MANSKHRSVLLALLAAAQGGCVSAIHSSDLYWEPPMLSQQGCPDLTGRYQDKGYLSQAFFAGLGGDKAFQESPIAERKIFRTPSVNGAPSDEMYAAMRTFNNRAVLLIQHEANVLKATLMDSTGEVYQQINLRLDTPMTGCHQGALIVRWETIGRRAEWGGGNVAWGEREIRKLSDGGLAVTYRQRQQSLSTLNGGVQGDTKTWPERTVQFPPAIR